MTVLPAATVLRALTDTVPAHVVRLFRWDRLTGNVGGIVALCGPTSRDAHPSFLLGTGVDTFTAGTITADVPFMLATDPGGTHDAAKLVAEWPTVTDALADSSRLAALIGARQHTWVRTRTGGSVRCAACGLLPLAEGDLTTACTTAGQVVA